MNPLWCQVFLIAVAINYGSALNCYTCNSLSHAGCGEPVDIQHNLMNCDDMVPVQVNNQGWLTTLLEQHTKPAMYSSPKTCLKVVARTSGPQSPNQTVVIRHCALKESADTCRSIRDKLDMNNRNRNNYIHHDIDECETCEDDLCNGTSNVSVTWPAILVIGAVAFIRSVRF